MPWTFGLTVLSRDCSSLCGISESDREMPSASSAPLVTTHNVSRPCQMFPRGQNHPRWNHCHKTTCKNTGQAGPGPRAADGSPQLRREVSAGSRGLFAHLGPSPWGRVLGTRSVGGGAALWCVKRPRGDRPAPWDCAEGSCPGDPRAGRLRATPGPHPEPTAPRRGAFLFACLNRLSAKCTWRGYSRARDPEREAGST